MKQRLGAVLSVLLGSGLIWIGLASSGTATAATVSPGPPTCQLPDRAVHQPRGEDEGCPTGTITVTEVTDLSADPSANPPSQWTVTVTSTNCTMPDGSVVDQVLVIDNNSSATTDQLFLYAEAFSPDVPCEYAYVETPRTPYTTTYDPVPPQSIPNTGEDSNLAVTVTNTIAALSTSASPTHTRTHTATATPTHTKSTSSSAAPTAVTSASSSAAPILAVTGPRSSVRPSLYAGIGLCGLGLVLLLAGRRPRTARHR